MKYYINFRAEIKSGAVTSLIANLQQAVMVQQNGEKFDEVVLYISTYGGHVKDGIDAYNYIKLLPFKVTTVNLGYVDSIGGVLFSAGGKKMGIIDYLPKSLIECGRAGFCGSGGM